MFWGYTFESGDPLPPFVTALTKSSPYGVVRDYLAASPLPARNRNFVGHIDQLDERGVGGWAMDLWRNEPISVRLVDSGRLVATAVCDVPREDVRSDGFPRSECGFVVEFSEPVLHPGACTLYFEDSFISLPRRRIG